MEKEKFVSVTKELLNYAKEEIEREIKGLSGLKLDFNTFLECDIDWYLQAHDVATYIVRLEEELKKPIDELKLEEYRDEIEAILSIDLVNDTIGYSDNPLYDCEEEYTDYLEELPSSRYRF